LPGYAPAGENDTAAYLRHINEKTGIDVNGTRVSQLTPAQLDAMVAAMHSYEGLGEGRVIKRAP
jgi:hypothetical protein